MKRGMRVGLHGSHVGACVSKLTSVAPTLML